MTWKNAIKTKRLKPGKTKMVTLGLKTVTVGQLDDEYFATGRLMPPYGMAIGVGWKNPRWVYPLSIASVDVSH